MWFNGTNLGGRSRVQFAPVANLATYARLLEMGLLDNYHLLIATEVAKDLENWGEFWSYPSIPPEIGKDMFIIMDNGVIETGQALDPQTLGEAANAVDASCIVLPDVLGDAGKTIKVAKAAFSELNQIGRPLMGVVQGQTFEQTDAVVDLYQRLGVKYLSIPRVMVRFFGTRIKLIRRYQNVIGPIHLLGFSDNIFDDIYAAHEPSVMGIDSATPLWCQIDFPDKPPVANDYGKRPQGYWSMDPDEMNYKNVERVRAWLTGASDVRSRGGQLALGETPTPPSA